MGADSHQQGKNALSSLDAIQLASLTKTLSAGQAEPITCTIEPVIAGESKRRDSGLLAVVTANASSLVGMGSASLTGV